MYFFPLARMMKIPPNLYDFPQIGSLWPQRAHHVSIVRRLPSSPVTQEIALDACNCLRVGYIRHVLTIDRYILDILEEYQQSSVIQ